MRTWRWYWKALFVLLVVAVAHGIWPVFVDLFLQPLAVALLAVGLWK